MQKRTPPRPLRGRHELDLDLHHGLGCPPFRGHPGTSQNHASGHDYRNIFELRIRETDRRLLFKVVIY